MPRVIVYSRDIVMVLALSLMVILVVINWGDYANCQYPLNVWLVVDYGAFILFRLIQFAFQYASNGRRQSAFTRWGPKLLAFANLYILYPFIWVWCVIGSYWLNQSNGCLDNSTNSSEMNSWSFLAWLIFSYVYLLAFGVLIFLTYRLRSRDLRGDGLVGLQGLLVQLQHARAYAIAPEPGLSEEDINSIPTTSLSDVSVSGSHEEETCSICLAGIDPSGTIRDIPCHHRFHQACLDQWLAMKDSCPNCVRPIVGAADSSALLTPGNSGHVQAGYQAV